MEQYKIGEVEMKFAEIIWRLEPVSLVELTEAVRRELGWKKSETERMVKQLCGKGIFVMEMDLVKARVFRSAFRQASPEEEKSESLAGRDGKSLKKSSGGFRHSFWAPIAFEEGDTASRIKNIMKYRKTFAVFTVCAVLVCILGGALFLMKAGGSRQEVVKETGEKDGQEQYSDFIAKIQSGILDNFRTVSTEELGISPYFMDYDKKMLTLGYCFLDLDSDGLCELIIGEYEGDKSQDEVNRIFGIYKLQDKEVVQVVYVSDEDSYRENYYLCDNGCIVKERRMDSDESYSYYTYGNGGLNLRGLLIQHGRSWFYSEEEVLWEEAQPIHRTKAAKIKSEYTYKDLSFQVFVEKDKVVEARTLEASQVVYPDQENLTFADLGGILFWHGSGAGAWSTQLIIESDGSFKGYYHGGAGGGGYYYEYTISDCYFSGKFTNLTKIGPYEYSMKCQDFQTEGKLGEECIIGKTRYITAEPYGFLDADEVRLYLPGKLEKDLPAEYLGWYMEGLEYGILTSYGLLNVGDGSGYTVHSTGEPVYEVGRGVPSSDEASKNSPRSDEGVKAFINGLREDYDPESVKYSLADLAGTYFWSYHGGGSSSFEIQADGMFYGSCGDGQKDMKYVGRFYDMTKIGPSVYLLRCKYAEITDYAGHQQIASYPYGFDFADEFILYLREKDSLNPIGAGSLYNIRGDISFVVPHG